MLTRRTLLPLLAVLVAGLPATPALAQADGAGVTLAENWQTFRDQRTGLAVQVPSRLMRALPDAPENTVRVYGGDDGSRLTLLARANSAGTDLATLERQVRESQPPGTRILYDARAANWFVIAGRRGDDEFYERHHITRDGATVSGFVATYPAALGYMYDALVARMSRTFVPAARLGGTTPAAAATPTLPRTNQPGTTTSRTTQPRPAQPRPAGPPGPLVITPPRP
jgi:hypothetical protein